MSTYTLLGLLHIVTNNRGEHRLRVPNDASPLTPDRARSIAQWLERWSDGEERKEQSNG